MKAEDYYDKFFGEGRWEERYKEHIVIFAKKYHRSQLQALKEGVIHDEAELDEAATEYINGPGKAYPRGGGFKDGALWMVDWIKTNLITNLEDNG